MDKFEALKKVPWLDGSQFFRELCDKETFQTPTQEMTVMLPGGPQTMDCSHLISWARCVEDWGGG